MYLHRCRGATDSLLMAPFAQRWPLHEKTIRARHNGPLSIRFFELTSPPNNTRSIMLHCVQCDMKLSTCRNTHHYMPVHQHRSDRTDNRDRNGHTITTHNPPALSHPRPNFSLSILDFCMCPFICGTGHFSTRAVPTLQRATHTRIIVQTRTCSAVVERSC